MNAFLFCPIFSKSLFLNFEIVPIFTVFSNCNLKTILKIFLLLLLIPQRLIMIINILRPKKELEFLSHLPTFYINFYQWLRHYTCSGFCKTSYHLLISPPPTNLANTLKIHTGENKIDRQGRQYTCYFRQAVRRIRMFFSLKPFQFQGESSLKISARWGLPFRRSQGTS